MVLNQRHVPVPGLFLIICVFTEDQQTRQVLIGLFDKLFLDPEDSEIINRAFHQTGKASTLMDPFDDPGHEDIHHHREFISRGTELRNDINLPGLSYRIYRHREAEGTVKPITDRIAQPLPPSEQRFEFKRSRRAIFIAVPSGSCHGKIPSPLTYRLFLMLAARAKSSDLPKDFLIPVEKPNFLNNTLIIRLLPSNSAETSGLSLSKAS